MNDSREPRVFSVPGKTFLLGEYLALNGGPSILLSTAPRFQLKISSGVQKTTFPSGSPADLLLQKYASNFSDLNGLKLEFIDPHFGSGGLGASSAQFALLWAALHDLKHVDSAAFDWSKLLGDYLSCAWSGKGSPPSGADVVSQMSGGVSVFDGQTFKVESLNWRFPELSFSLFQTGRKLATHEHLKVLPNEFPHIELRKIVREAAVAFKEANEERLCAAVTSYAEALSQASLVAHHTLGILESAKRENFVRAAKGCGALGADVILILHDRGQEPTVETWASEHGLKSCGGLLNLCHGFESREI
jgi:mevalonate kinase